MNVLIIADDDSAISQLPENRTDLLISCGDLVDLSISRAAARCKCKQILAVKGNHDSSAPFPSPVVDLHLRTFEFDGLRFGGFCGSWKYKPRGNYLFEQSEVEAVLSAFPKVDVFVAHNSPFQIHDKDDDVHLGFVSFASYIQKHQPRFFVHGHQHVSKETRSGLTRVVGTYGFRYLAIGS
jgi:Icc-related predicted phosphoesterase